MLKIVFATTTAMVSVGPGNHTTIHAGEHWPANDPIVASHPDLFTSDPTVGLRVSVPLVDDDEQETADAGKPQAPVEQATKAPGEKRPTRRA